MTDSLERARDFDFDAARARTPLPASVQTVEDIARWREEHAEAIMAVERLARERSRTLASATVEEIQALDASAATARIRTERAAAVIERGEVRLAELAERHRAAQPERRKKHEAALEARDEAERVIREVYGPAADMVAQALTKLAELEGVIRAAGEPPEGEDRVPSYEAFRHVECRYHTALATAVTLPGVLASDAPFWPPRA